MKYLADVNILFPLCYDLHDHREKAAEWWEERGAGEIALHVVVRLGVLRLLCNAPVMGEEILQPKEALAAWDVIDSDPRTFRIGAAPSQLESCLLKNVKDRKPNPKLWTDAYLAAYAEAEGWTMTTFDKGFSKFHLTNLEVLTP